MARRRSSPRLGRPDTMRIVNRTVVMDTIREQGAVSRAGIARLTSISAPTVSAIVADLVREGLVRELEQERSNLGRPGRLLAFNENAWYVGCDLSLRGTVQLGLVNMRDHIVEVDAHDYEPTSTHPNDVVEVIASYIERLSNRTEIRVRGVGVGSPGLTDVEHGVVRWAPALGWKNVCLAELLNARLDIPVVVDNDVNLALIGEVNQGVASHARDAVFVAFADGIGGALLINGQLYRGHGGAAGEVGYVVTDTLLHGQGARPLGLLEQRFFDLLSSDCQARGIKTAGMEHEMSVLVNALRNDDAELELHPPTRESMIATLGAALASVTALLDPEVIVLGGWIRLLGDDLLAQLASGPGILGAGRPALRFSKLGGEAVIAGGAVSVRHRITGAMHMVAAN